MTDFKKIKPRVKRGQVVCTRACPSCEGRTNWETWFTCTISGDRVLQYDDYDDPCTPYYQAALRKATHDLETLKKGMRRLREVYPQVLLALENGSGCTEDVSLEFIEKIPDEIRNEVTRMRKRCSHLEMERDAANGRAADEAERIEKLRSRMDLSIENRRHLAEDLQHVLDALEQIAGTSTSMPAADNDEAGHYRQVAYSLIGIAAHALNNRPPRKGDRE